MLEEIPKNDDYRCQLQARRSFTVTDMLGHLLSILWVNILAQEPLLIVRTMIIHPRHVWHLANLDLVWKIFFMGWIKMRFPEDANTKVLVFKGLPVLSFFLANYWQCSSCFHFCFPIIQYMKNSMCLFTVPWTCQTMWAFSINMSSQHSFSRELSLHSFEVQKKRMSFFRLVLHCLSMKKTSLTRIKILITTSVASQIHTPESHMLE